MRDGDIIGRFELMAEAMTSDIMKLQRGIALIRTRQDAFERLILHNRFGLWRMALFQLFMPSYVAKLMKLAHAEEIRQFEEARKAAAMGQGPIKAPPKPTLVVA